MPGSIDVDELVALLQRGGRGDGGDGGRARGGGPSRGNGGGRGQGWGGRGRGGDGRGGRPERGRSQGGGQRARGGRGAEDEDPFGVRDWFCGGCGVANRHWRQRCFGCDGRREIIEEGALGQPRTAAARPPANARNAPTTTTSQGTRPTGPTRSTAPQPVLGNRPKPGAAAATARGPPQQQPPAASRPASAALDGRTYLAAAATRDISLRPGGWKAGIALSGNTHMHANSQNAAGKDATPTGTRGGGAGDQQQGGAAGGGAPRTRTVSIAEARKGAADADGFIRAQQPTKPKETLGSDACGSGDTPCGDAMDTDEGDQGGGHDCWADWTEDADEQDGEGGEPTEEDLKGYLEAAREVLAYAKRQGYPPEHPVRKNAQRQVEEALAEWQAVRPPRAIPTRMGWAEEALQRARRAQTKVEQELEELDKRYEQEREEKLQALQDARERTKLREKNLAELSKEAAAEYRVDDADDSAKMLQGTFRTLDAEVGPALEAALGKAEQGTEQHAALQRALQAVLVLHGALGVAAGGAPTDFFDMARHDDDDAATQGTATHEGTRGDGMDTTAARAPRWMEQHDNKRGGADSNAPGIGSPPPRWKKNRTTGEEGGPSAEGATPPSAPAGGKGNDAPTTQGSEQGDEFATRRAQIVAQAKSEGADAPEEYLLQLAPEALEEWARENLV